MPEMYHEDESVVRQHFCTRKVVKLPVSGPLGMVTLVSQETECDVMCTTGPLERQVPFVNGILRRHVEIGPALFCPQEL